MATTIPKSRRFLLKWETVENSKLGKLTAEEKDILGTRLSYQEVGELSVKAFSDENARRKRKWKEIRHFWNLSQMKEYSNTTLENVFWKLTYGTYNIPSELFLTSMLSSFAIPSGSDIDKHLRWLYWSFEGGSEDRADWRDIFASCRILTLARMVSNGILHVIHTQFLTCICMSCTPISMPY
jgi:hypothetical protein